MWLRKNRRPGGPASGWSTTSWLHVPRHLLLTTVKHDLRHLQKLRDKVRYKYHDWFHPEKWRVLGRGRLWVSLCIVYDVTHHLSNPRQFQKYGSLVPKRTEDGQKNEFIKTHYNFWKKELKIHPLLRKAEYPSLFREQHSFLLTNVRGETSALMVHFLS